jgi:hypothetical protein
MAIIMTLYIFLLLDTYINAHIHPSKVLFYRQIMFEDSGLNEEDNPEFQTFLILDNRG